MTHLPDVPAPRPVPFVRSDVQRGPMSEDVEVSSEETGDTVVTEESGSQPEASTAEQHTETQEAAPETTTEEKPAPFHEHPRFKELIESNRTYKEQLEKQREDFIRLQTQMESFREQSKPKVEQPKDPFLADLEKVNPEYAKSLQGIYKQAGMVQELQNQLAQFQQAQFAEKAVSHFNKLLDDRKVTDPLDRKIMDRAVRAEVYEQESRGRKLNLKDLEKITDDFYSEYKAGMDARERATTAKYVQGKTQDKTPKGATGGAAKAPTTKKLAANDFSGQAKWLADQIRGMKKEH